MSAVISADGVYRYRLDREWIPGRGRVVFIMLNSSTADANLDDPTIRRCTGFAVGWGYQSLTVVNLFALRATDPRELANHPDPVGPDNDYQIGQALLGANLIVCAWGASFPAAHADRVAKFEADAAAVGAHHLGLTKAGHPRHPLYIRSDTKPARWAA